MATEGAAVLLLNADCVLDDGFLAAARPQLDAAGGGLGRAAAHPRDAGWTPPTGSTCWTRRAWSSTGGARTGSSATASRPRAGRRRGVFGGDGACVLYRREVLEACAVGGEVLDEDLALWASDVDLAWRARLLGWRCVYEPAAMAWHVRFYSPSTRAGLPRAHRRLQFRNRLLMMAKNDTWRRRAAATCTRSRSTRSWRSATSLLRERDLLGGYRDAWRGLPAARRRRAWCRPRRPGCVRRSGCGRIPASRTAVGRPAGR